MTTSSSPFSVGTLSALRFSGRILTRHLTLIYPMLLFSLLADGLRPQETPALEWRWLVWLGLFLLLKAAFTCGWYGCICAAVEDALTQLRRQSPEGDQFQPVEPATPWPRSFRYYKAFFPSIGRYFLPFIVGEAVFWLLELLLIGVVIGIGLLNGIPSPLLSTASIPPEAWQSVQQFDAWVQGLSPANLNALLSTVSMLLAGTALAIGLSFLTQFWVFYVLLLQQNPLLAPFKSMGFTLKNALSLTLQFTPVSLLYACFVLLASLKASWLSFIGIMGITISGLWTVLLSASFFYSRFEGARLLPADEGDQKVMPAEKPSA